jgi:hypothetical protein
MASTYLSRTASGGSRTTWTISTWVKRGSLGSSLSSNIFNGIIDGSNETQLLFLNDSIEFYDYSSASRTGTLVTNAKYRDTSAWYHIVAVWDTTNATAGDRMRLYVNGVEETSFATDTQPSLNQNSSLGNGTYTQQVGLYSNNSSYYFNGSMTHLHFIDGTAYDASTFGETDATTGIWKPKTAPSVTYGTNGFFLKFENSGSMGLDSSPNANNFTVNGTLTQTVDTPSNVFATLNALTTTNALMIFTNGNTTCTATGNWLGNVGTLGATKGKWYAEAKITDTISFSIGFAKFGGTFQNNMNTPNSGYLGIGNDSWGFWGNGPSANLYHNSTQTSYGSVTSTNDIMMLAMDLDNGNLYWGKNGTWFNSSNPATSTSPAFSGINIDEYITFGTGVEGSSVQWNFGNGYFGTTAVSSATTDESGLGIFEYTVPSGYYALCTKNINEQEYD